MLCKKLWNLFGFVTPNAPAILARGFDGLGPTQLSTSTKLADRSSFSCLSVAQWIGQLPPVCNRASLVSDICAKSAHFRLICESVLSCLLVEGSFGTASWAASWAALQLQEPNSQLSAQLSGLLWKLTLTELSTWWSCQNMALSPAHEVAHGVVFLKKQLYRWSWAVANGPLLCRKKNITCYVGTFRGSMQRLEKIALEMPFLRPGWN
jgi:hypothetical protein